MLLKIKLKTKLYKEENVVIQNIVVEDQLSKDTEVFKSSSNLVSNFLSKSNEMPARYQQHCTPQNVEENE